MAKQGDWKVLALKSAGMVAGAGVTGVTAWILYSRFMLDQEDVIKSFRPEWMRETGNQIALALECDSPAEVDEVYRRVVESGFTGEKEPWDAFWGQRYAQLLDPDGVPVDLYAPL